MKKTLKSAVIAAVAGSALFVTLPAQAFWGPLIGSMMMTITVVPGAVVLGAILVMDMAILGMVTLVTAMAIPAMAIPATAILVMVMDIPMLHLLPLHLHLRHQQNNKQSLRQKNSPLFMAGFFCLLSFQGPNKDTVS